MAVQMFTDRNHGRNAREAFNICKRRALKESTSAGAGTIAEKEDYFTHFLMRRPERSIDDRLIEVDCNSATDSGLYTFRFADGTKVKARYSFAYKKIGSEWLITSHHSSAMPEKPEASVEAHAAHAAPVAAKAAPAKAAEAPETSTKGWVRYP